MSSKYHNLGNKIFKKFNNHYTISKVRLSTVKFRLSELPNKIKILLSIGGLVGTTGLGVCYALNNSVKAAEIICHPNKYPWPHSYGLGKFFGTFDAASVRRGWEVYKNVCAACHSINFVKYREMVGEFLTEEEAKNEAAEIQVLDGPDNKGNMFMRPGKLFDAVPAPYPNEEAARAANNGAYPPDLSFITIARHGGADYIFSLLTGYCDPPAGHEIDETQSFNPYFSGGNISMPPPLYNETIEYSDGTPATRSQLAKDVVHFLSWCAEPETEKKRLLFIKGMLLMTILTLSIWYMKRHVWSTIVSRQIFYKDVHKKEIKN